MSRFVAIYDGSEPRKDEFKYGYHLAWLLMQTSHIKDSSQRWIEWYNIVCRTPGMSWLYSYILLVHGNLGRHPVDLHLYE